MPQKTQQHDQKRPTIHQHTGFCLSFARLNSHDMRQLACILLLARGFTDCCRMEVTSCRLPSPESLEFSHPELVPFVQLLSEPVI